MFGGPRYRQAVSLLVASLVLVQRLNAQAIDPNLIDFTTVPQWPDLPQCLVDIFYYTSNPIRQGCRNNICLCEPERLGKGIDLAEDQAISSCSYLNDREKAKTVFKQYCSSHGKTVIATPITLSSSGASTVTVTVTKAVSPGLANSRPTGPEASVLSSSSSSSSQSRHLTAVVTAILLSLLLRARVDWF